MAHYVYMQLRDSTASPEPLNRLAEVSRMLTPEPIRDECASKEAAWPNVPGAYYAIQNSDGVSEPDAGALIIGWIDPASLVQGSHVPSVESDGSYAVIKADHAGVRFFCDQFGSRTLWYYLDDEMLVVSTSQRAIVHLKRRYVPNQAAVGWFLSSGCQGPFISWDAEIAQVHPRYEYVLDAASWHLERRAKPAMELPQEGTQSWDEYLTKFEAQVSQALVGIIGSCGPGEVLLPLSGGLDSRLLFALSRHAGLDRNLELVNWGLAPEEGAFDDKVAARRIAAFYGHTLHDYCLPWEVEDYDNVLEGFVAASEGRIDHLNAYTDGFSMWADLARNGCRYVIRGDIPFTEGVDIGEASARAHIGLDLFSDFDNSSEFPLEGLSDLQEPFDLDRLPEESLVRWRDRLYVEWRIPMVISAFSAMIGGFVENRCPMMSWRLYRDYMALPDRMKGNKKHIAALWRRHDQSGIPSHAVSSLQTQAALFSTARGVEFLKHYLLSMRGSRHVPAALVDTVLAKLGENSDRAVGQPVPAFVRSARAWLSDRFPGHLKGYIKAKRPRRLSPIVLAYRLVLVEKTLRLYQSASGTDIGHPRAVGPSHPVTGTQLI